MNTDQTDKQAYLADPYAMAYPETQPFWAAAESGRLLLKTCKHCGKAHWYPRVVCPLCGNDDTIWSEASGLGVVHAFSFIERADPPYVLAYIELQEGPIILSNIIDCPFDTLTIGMPVRARFLATQDGRSAPYFAPA